jgi:hypothetical protein
LDCLGRIPGSSGCSPGWSPSVMKWGCLPRPGWSFRPLCTRSRSRPKPSPLANVGRVQTPEGVRCACRPTRFAKRDPKTTPGSSGWADVRTPRQSEDHGGGQRHTEVDGPSSQAPDRSVAGSELPTVRPKPIRFPSAHQQLVSPDERPASPGHRVAPPHRQARTEVLTSR